ncbi:unnamed protein product [Cladocopium goreaui]|uniref:Uncharacterized protein n=1 Tax=Cladocopium goreaui TaxID=2562237 RepID=A0A9P1FQN2_9DINO|nr:unnamed protein product [Cladocopium goreaui]
MMSGTKVTASGTLDFRNLRRKVGKCALTVGACHQVRVLVRQRRHAVLALGLLEIAEQSSEETEPPLPSPSGVPESSNWAKGYVDKLGLVHLADSCRLAGVQKALAEEFGFEPVTTSVSEPVSWKQNFMFDNHPRTSPLVAPIDFMLYGRMDDGEPFRLCLIPGYSVSVEKLDSVMFHMAQSRKRVYIIMVRGDLCNAAFAGELEML